MPPKPGPLRPHEERNSYARRPTGGPIPGQPELGDTFLIVTEGEITERLYFEKLRAMLQLSASYVYVVHPSCTDAEGLIKSAIIKRDRPHRNRGDVGISEIINFDHVWVVFDTDVPERQHQLASALALAQKEKINVALSTPCVEFWLLLHFSFTTGLLLDSAKAEKAVGKAWRNHYDKSEATFIKLWPDLQFKIPIAVRNAEKVRKHHTKACTPEPANPSTDVDRLICALNSTVQPSLRIF